MSTISNQISSNLASTLLQLTSQTSPADTSDGGATDSGELADTLNLSGSSIAELEQQAQTIASQNQSSALATSEDAFAANLAAVAAISGSPAQAQAAQGAPDSGSVLGLIGGS